MRLIFLLTCTLMLNACDAQKPAVAGEMGQVSERYLFVRQLAASARAPILFGLPHAFLVEH